MPEQISVVAPVDPESLNYQLQAASQLLRRRGPEYEVKIPNYRLSFLCEAGKTTSIPFPLPANFVCLPPGSEIFTNPSFTPIEQIKEGDTIANEDTVTGTFERSYKGNLVKLKPRYLEAVSFTPNHPILVKERARTKKHQPVRLATQPVWKEACEIKPGVDYVAIPKGLLEEKDITLNLGNPKDGTWSREEERIIKEVYPKDIAEAKRLLSHRPLAGIYHKSSRTKRGFERKYRLEGEVPLTKELAEIFGWYVAEGSIASKGEFIRFSLGPQESNAISRVAELIRLLGYRPHIRSAETATDVLFCSKRLAEFITKNFGKGAKNKTIPDFIFKAKREYKLAFFEGVIKGDGYQRVREDSNERKYAEISLTNKQLIKQLQMLALSLGFVGTYYMSKNDRGKINGRRIKGTPTHILSLSLEKPKKRIYLEDDYYYYFPIVGKTTFPYEGKVHNLETRTGTFLVPFVTHNCTRRAPLQFEWTRHSDDIKVDVWVDSEFKVNPYGLVATGDFTVDFGVYYVKHHRIDIDVDNQSDNDTLMTLSVNTSLLRKELYESWYEPIVRRSQYVLTSIAEEEKTPAVTI